MQNEPTPTDLQDAQLTALALGELDADERARVEARIREHPELTGEVEAIRATATAVETAFAAEPALALHDAQRDAIESEITGTGTAPHPFVRTRTPAWLKPLGLALAACLALVVLLPMLINPDGADRKQDDVALNQAQPQPETNTRGRAQFELEDENVAAEPSFEGTVRETAMGDGGARRFDSLRAGSTAGSDARMAEVQPSEPDAPAGSAAPPLPADRSLNDSIAMPGGGGGQGGGGSARPAGAPSDGLENRRSHLRSVDETLVNQQLDEAGRFEDLARNEEYAQPQESPFITLKRQAEDGEDDHNTNDESHLSTFAVDVDTAAYSNIRRMLLEGRLPPAEAVRIEEMLNYFAYSDPAPADGDEHPIRISSEIATCPWNTNHRLARVTLKAQPIDMANRVGANLVFLIDVSGSMNRPDKLPLLQQAMVMLVNELTADDTVSIITYAGRTDVALQPTPASRKNDIRDAIDVLRSGGSTHGSAGIEHAYQLAEQARIAGGANRVIWATDGDLNVGVTNNDALVELIEAKRASGVMLTVLGFGSGNLKDSKLEAVSNAGNGSYAYIDSESEARKVLVEQIGGTLFTVARDVKVQVEFNPAEVESYRLIGYDNRRLAAADFRNDAKDAGEMGASHAVTALYEIVPVGPRVAQQDNPDFGGGGGGARGAGGGGSGGGGSSPARRDREDAPAMQEADDQKQVRNDWSFQVHVRYKPSEGQPDAPEEASEFSTFAFDSDESFESASNDFQFAAAVATFGLVLRQSEFAGDASFNLARELATPGANADIADAYRKEFIDLINRAAELRE
ncbi:MAG: YfbK domain-containing protein [Phycisphaerales bacterium]